MNFYLKLIFNKLLEHWGLPSSRFANVMYFYSILHIYTGNFFTALWLRFRTLESSTIRTIRNRPESFSRKKEAYFSMINRFRALDNQIVKLLEKTTQIIIQMSTEVR
jgi:hypothetical protein